MNSLDDSFEWTSELYESIEVVSIGQPSEGAGISAAVTVIAKPLLSHIANE